MFDNRKYDKKKAHTAAHTHKNHNKITFCHIYNSWALNKIMKDQGQCVSENALPPYLLPYFISM